MDKPISVGDLVVGIHDCCGGTNPWLGKVFTVASIGTGTAECKVCGFSYRGLNVSNGEKVKGGMKGVPITWVKRIPPLLELETGITEETLKEKS